MRYTLLKNRITGERRVYNAETKEYISEVTDKARYDELRKKAINNRNRAERDQAYRDCGLVKVRGSMGGAFWE